MIVTRFRSRALGGPRRLIAVAACLTTALVTHQASATIIATSNGFEPDAGYSTTFLGTGQLEGQMGSTPPVSQLWVRTVGPATSTGVVQSAIKHSGSQAVQVTRFDNSDDRWGLPVIGWPSQPIVTVDWDMYVTQTPDAGGTFGPFFGIDAYDSDGSVGGTGLLGSLGVDATTGDVLYQAGGTGVLTETGATVAFDTWNHFLLCFDYAFDQYTVFLNGQELATTSFVDSGLDQFTDANLAALAAGPGASLSRPGIAYFDNYVVQQFPNKASVPIIPEPSTWILGSLAFALVAVSRYGKK